MCVSTLIISKCMDCNTGKYQIDAASAVKSFWACCKRVSDDDGDFPTLQSQKPYIAIHITVTFVRHNDSVYMEQN